MLNLSIKLEIMNLLLDFRRGDQLFVLFIVHDLARYTAFLTD